MAQKFPINNFETSSKIKSKLDVLEHSLRKNVRIANQIMFIKMPT